MLCKPCILGHSCPTANLTTPIPCQAGYYANDTGSVKCTPCPYGLHCPNPASSPVKCSDGKYSPGICSECIDCSSGYRYVIVEEFLNNF